MTQTQRPTVKPEAGKNTLPEPQRAESDGIKVTISLRPELQPDGRAFVCGETNLPLGTTLMVSLVQKGVTGFYEAKCVVGGGGRFRCGPLGRQDGLPPGAYAADVVMPYVRLQSLEVRRVIGAQGERLAGPLVERSASGVSVHFSTTLVMGGDSARADQKQSSPAPAKEEPSREIIGRWLNEGVLTRKITLFQQGGKLLMETLWSDGRGGTSEMVDKSSGAGRLFQAAPGTGHAGEFYLIDSQGDLQLWDPGGLVWTAQDRVTVVYGGRGAAATEFRTQYAF